jgi:Ca2+-binding RTX toxin-like protein
VTTMTDAEQLMLELINRARLDPAAEAARYGIDLNKDLSPGRISAVAKQPLAPNDLLRAASRDHSDWMLAQDVFSHTGDGGSSPGQRMVAAGYSFTGSWTWGENIAWQGTTGTIALGQFIKSQHQGLFLSAGHRVNTLNDSFRELGVGSVTGTFTVNGTGYNALMTTLGFAKSASALFVSGVIHDDGDLDAFYSIGEGRAGVQISARNGAGEIQSLDTSAASGGYANALAVTHGDVDLRFSGGGLPVNVRATLGIEGQNIKVDLVDGLTLRSSADIALRSGARHIELLGITDIDATGNAAANTLTGNAGSNLIAGAAGNDRLFGNAGADTLMGGSGNDLLNGGSGADRMAGGPGDDNYVVNDAADLVLEASDNGNDTIRSSISLTLRANVENLTLISAKPDSATGNELPNLIIGGAGNNRLDGRGGSDTLTGADGADSFVFSIAPGPDNLDHISDFAPGIDRIVLLEAVFSGVGAKGALAASAFHSGSAASDAAHRIIHDGSTGALWYDADGNGGQPALQFAQLGTGVALSAADFLIA